MDIDARADLILNPGDRMYGLFGPLALRKDGLINSVQGTAFLLQPPFAVTARHVLEEYFGEARIGVHPWRDGCELLLILPSEGRTPVIFSVLAATSDPRFDIALLVLKDYTARPPATVHDAPRIRLSPPMFSHAVYAYGCPATEFYRVPERRLVEVGITCRRTLGAIDVLYPDGRDRALLPGPSFQFSAPVTGGCSGGPILDGNGAVVGVVSSSLDLDGGRPVSFGTLAWTLCQLPVSSSATGSPNWPGIFSIWSGRIPAVDARNVRLSWGPRARLNLQLWTPAEFLRSSEAMIQFLREQRIPPTPEVESQ